MSNNTDFTPMPQFNQNAYYPKIELTKDEKLKQELRVLLEQASYHMRHFDSGDYWINRIIKIIKREEASHAGQLPVKAPEE